MKQQFLKWYQEINNQSASNFTPNPAVTRVIADKTPAALDIEDLKNPDKIQAVAKFCQKLQSDPDYFKTRAGLFTQYSWEFIKDTCMASDNDTIRNITSLKQLQNLPHIDFFTFLSSQFNDTTQTKTGHSVVTVTQFHDYLANFKLPRNRELFSRHSCTP